MFYSDMSKTAILITLLKRTELVSIFTGENLSHGIRQVTVPFIHLLENEREARAAARDKYPNFIVSRHRLAVSPWIFLHATSKGPYYSLPRVQIHLGFKFYCSKITDLFCHSYFWRRRVAFDFATSLSRLF